MTAGADRPEPLLRYDEWVSYVFDNPVPEVGLAWYWDHDDWDPLAAPEVVVGYLTTAFENIATVAAPYSDAQVAQALEYLINNACSSHMFVLLEASVPLEKRLDCVRAFFAVYRDVFAPRCSAHLGHRRTGAPARTCTRPARTRSMASVICGGTSTRLAARRATQPATRCTRRRCG